MEAQIQRFSESVEAYRKTVRRYSEGEATAIQKAQLGQDVPALNAVLAEWLDAAKEAKQALLDAALSLAEALEAAGLDASGVLAVRHAADTGDGLPGVERLWPDLEVSLRRIGLRAGVAAEQHDRGPLGFTPPPAPKKPEADKVAAGHGGDQQARHSPDFRSVFWFGERYSFTGNQAKCVRILWEAWENETPDVSGAFILEELDIQDSSGRLDQVFRNPGGKGYHPAWGTMIVPGQTKGTYRLKELAG